MFLGKHPHNFPAWWPLGTYAETTAIRSRARARRDQVCGAVAGANGACASAALSAAGAAASGGFG